MGVVHVTVGLTLVYLCFYLLHRYVRARSEDEDEETDLPQTTASTRFAETTRESRNRAPATGRSGVLCTVCGAENDSSYTFCRNCVAELPKPGSSEPMETQPL